MNAVREFGNSSLTRINTWASGWPLRDTAFEEAPTVPKRRSGLLATGGAHPARRHSYIIRYIPESVNPENYGGKIAQDSTGAARFARVRPKASGPTRRRVFEKSPENAPARARFDFRRAGG